MLRSPQRADGRVSSENDTSDSNGTLDTNPNAQSVLSNSSNMTGQSNRFEVSAASIKLPGF